MGPHYDRVPFKAEPVLHWSILGLGRTLFIRSFFYLDVLLLRLDFWTAGSTAE